MPWAEKQDHHRSRRTSWGVRAGLYPVDGPARQYSSWRIPMLHCFTVLDTVNITSWTNFFQTKMIMITTSVPDVITYHSLTAWITVVLYLGYSSKTCINLPPASIFSNYSYYTYRFYRASYVSTFLGVVILSVRPSVRHTLAL